MESIFAKNGSETPEPVRATVSGESGLGAPSGVEKSKKTTGFGARFRGSVLGWSPAALPSGSGRKFEAQLRSEEGCKPADSSVQLTGLFRNICSAYMS